MNIEHLPITELKPATYNPRKITEQELSKLQKSIEEFGFVDPVIINKDRTIIGGHQRVVAAQRIGIVTIPCVILDLPKEKERILNLALNKISGTWDEEKLVLLLKELNDEEKELSGFNDQEIKKLLGNLEKYEVPKITDRFLISPFSILDSRQERWKTRKQQWMRLGIKSELGREENITFAQSAQSPELYELRNELKKKTGIDPSWEEVSAEAERRGIKMLTGTSIFDPVLCEIVYRWFCSENGVVLDPFAGGSVRGISAAVLKRNYIGVDLRADQVEANKKQAEEILKQDLKPQWITGDSQNVRSLVSQEADLIFTCPPYGDLENYSDDQRDLSNMDYENFLNSYRKIIYDSCQLLRMNRFAAIVVGDFRDEKGVYRNFISQTIKAFQDAGLSYYNEAILITPFGSLPMRITRQFTGSRKFGKTHQNVLLFVKGDLEQAIEEAGDYCKLLVFAKGDPKEATQAAGEIMISEETIIDGVEQGLVTIENLNS
jgi:ParB-like chromosome segregation protein Spo0J/DNA modification methylase